MFKYFSHTKDDVKEMLEKIHIEKIEDLFTDIPNEFIYKEDINIPSNLSELELRKHIKNIAKENKEYISFLGAGSYDVYAPSVINTITSRQEFLTSYTPYQAEISQGTLQYIFEFQSMICELTNMDVSNASVYDSSTATAEAMFMAINHTKRNKILLSKTFNPRIVDVVKTYAKFKKVEVKMIESEDYHTSLTDLVNNLDDTVAGVFIQNPNFYGVIEKIDEVVDRIKSNKSLLVMNVDPSTLPILKTPGEIGADIAVGDGQTLGINLSFGGPYIGFMATTEKLMRKIPGRIVGLTNDVDGKRGYVLTLQAREQHIRREKATSNICSNQSLMALTNVIYCSLMGKQGLVDIARMSYNNCHYLYEGLLKTKKFEKVTNQPFFKEIVLKCNVEIDKLNSYLLTNGFLGGLDIGNNLYLVCATEVRTKEEIDLFIKLVEEF